MTEEPLTEPTTSPTRRRPRLSDAGRRIVIALLILVALGGLLLTGRAAVTGFGDSSESLPDSVDRLIPASGDEVLRQSQVGIDVAEGYDAYLQINGVDIRASDGLIKDLGTGLIQYQPSPGGVIEELNPNQNCVTAFVWDRLEDESTAQPVSWCFEAT